MPLLRPRHRPFAFACRYGLFAVGIFGIPVAACAEHRLVSIGDRRLSIDCEGTSSSSETVVLMAGQGRTAGDWVQVQPAVSRFVRVCSYDRAGLGESDKTSEPQSAAEIVEDLHALLKAAGEKTPYVLVGHSIAGIYCRRFVTRFARDVKGLVFVDSSHEEQSWRLHEVDPKGPAPNEALADLFFVKPGQKLDWNTKLPLIVIEHGKPGPPMPGLTEEQNAAFGRIWNELQKDLAKRLPKGQFRLAGQSGHFIQNDRPELVIQAIRDVIRTR